MGNLWNSIVSFYLEFLQIVNVNEQENIYKYATMCKVLYI